MPKIALTKQELPTTKPTKAPYLSTTDLSLDEVPSIPVNVSHVSLPEQPVRHSSQLSRGKNESVFMTENVLKDSDDNNSAFYSNSSDADGIEGGSRSLVPFMNDLNVVDPVESARKEAID